MSSETVQRDEACVVCGHPAADHEGDGPMLHDFVELDGQCPITSRRCDRPCGTACIRSAEGSRRAVQRVLELADEIEADSVLAKQLADDARAREDRELQRINMRHARVAHHAASSIRAAVAGPQRDHGEGQL